VTLDPPEPMTELLTCPVELPPLHRVQIHEETVNAILLLRTGLLIQLARANSEAVGTIQNNFGTNGFG
jgi:hypothetical protein